MEIQMIYLTRVKARQTFRNFFNKWNFTEFLINQKRHIAGGKMCKINPQRIKRIDWPWLMTVREVGVHNLTTTAISRFPALYLYLFFIFRYRYFILRAKLRSGNNKVEYGELCRRAYVLFIRKGGNRSSV